MAKVLPWMETSVRRKSTWSLLLGAVASLLIVRWLWFTPYVPRAPTEAEMEIAAMPCRLLPGAEDVLVILKTGATEAHHKLPVHFRTTLQCIPHYVIYSDMDENIEGYQLHDALDEVDPEIKQNNEDFALYNLLQDIKTSGEEGGLAKFEGANGGPSTKEGWNLDKWKFFPIMDKAYTFRPEAKWFVMIEADTYLVWSNMLQWLSKFDWSKPKGYYMGGQNVISDHLFAHGGSGIFMSQPAVKKFVELRRTNISKYDQMTKDHWAGDDILAYGLDDIGVKLLWSWPLVQGETPTSLNYNRDEWCHPAVTYHHADTSDIETAWQMEQEWRAKQPGRPILHGDVYRLLVEPQLNDTQDFWDNGSEDWEEEDAAAKHTKEGCRAACERRKKCTQYRYLPRDTRCRTGNSIRLGAASNDTHSGWLLDRIKAISGKHTHCKPKWILPDY